MAKQSEFSISYHDGWAMLTVPPKELQERVIYADEVSNRMKVLKIDSVRQKLVQDIIDRASGEPERLAPWPSGELYSATVSVELSEDHMTAWITAQPPKPGGEHVTRDMIEDALNECGVTHGIDWSALKRLVETGMYNRRIQAAVGTSVVQGEPRRIQYHFITAKKPFKELRYGRIDLKELNFIQNRKEGDLLAEMRDPVAPVDGVTVTGEISAAQPPGADEELRPGENVILSEGKLYAAMDGNAYLRAGKVHVEPVVYLQNVDYGSGNIDFEGSVIIKGTVADGFEVKATGDIQVGKCVGRVKIHAGRNLMLRSGVNGDKEARLYSGEECWSRYIEGCSLLCRGNVLVQESIMHSNLSVWGNLMLAGGRAELMGGSLLVQGSLWCRKLGGLYEPPTSVIMGVSPEILQDYTSLLTHIQKKRGELDNADKMVSAMEKKPPGVLDADKKTLADYQSDVSRLSEELGALQKKSHEIREEALPREGSVLVVEDIIYGGVQLSFGFKEYPLQTIGNKQVVLKCVKGTIVQQNFNPMTPPVIEDVV